ncbi:MAG: DUF2336 domain-containing protein [Acetobacteraceae bacterium]
MAAAVIGACRFESAPEMALVEGAPEMALDEEARVRLGALATTPPEVLKALVADASVTVRAAVALNPATPAYTNAALAADPDERVRALLARKLSAIAPSLSSGALNQLQQLTLDTLTGLAKDETVRVRAAIADAVKDLPDAPRAIILRLAHDDALMVCEPVVRFSPLLTSEDLVALVAATPSSGTQVAVARRLAIDTAVSDALVSAGKDDAVLALLMNGSAQIREATLDALVERSVENPAWHDPLVRRPALSERSVKTLARIVADHLLEVLAARSDLDPVLAADLSARVSERLRCETGVTAPTAPPAKPTEADLLAAARDGDARKAAVMLAIAADIPLPAVWRAAMLRSAKGLVSLTWKAGFSMRTGYAMQVLLARLAPGTALKPGPGNSFPLSVQEMCWQLDFLSGKER